MSGRCEHTFKTSISATRFEAAVAASCRAAYVLELIAHDPTLLPQVRIFNVTFANPEDRDRTRIAVRFIEQEQAERAASQAAPQVRRAAAVSPPARRLARA